jgi:hypothetical protein
MSGLVHLHQIPVKVLFARSFRSTRSLHPGIGIGWSIVCDYLNGCHLSSYFNVYKAMLYEIFHSDVQGVNFMTHVYDQLGIWIDENYVYKRAWATVERVLEIGINTPVTVVTMPAARTTMSFLASNLSLRWLAHRGPWPRLGLHHIAGEENRVRTPRTEGLILDLTYSLLEFLVDYSLANGLIRVLTADKLHKNLEDLQLIWGGLHDKLRYTSIDPVVINTNMVYF